MRKWMWDDLNKSYAQVERVGWRTRMNEYKTGNLTISKCFLVILRKSTLFSLYEFDDSVKLALMVLPLSTLNRYLVYLARLIMERFCFRCTYFRMDKAKNVFT